MSHKDKIKDMIVPNLHINPKNHKNSMKALINIMKIKINKIVPKVVKNKKYSLDMKVNCLSKILSVVIMIPKNKANLYILVRKIIIKLLFNKKYI
jgi:hypothetical protein